MAPDRRQLLGGGAAVLAGLLTGCGAPPPPGPGPSARRAVVVGAGLAGLVAAGELVRAGWEVEVLEAGDEAGGRIRTVVGAPLPEEAVMELGADLVHPAQLEVRGLAERLGVDLVPDDRPRAGLDGTACLEGIPTRFAALLGDPTTTAGLEAIRQAMQSHADTTMTGYSAAAAMDRSVREVLDEAAAPGPARALVESALLARHGIGLDRLSVQHAAQAWAGPVERGDLLRPEGGMAGLVTALVEGLDAPVRRRTAVTGVRQTSTRVEVVHRDGTANADRVVLAIPAGAVRRLDLPVASVGSAMEGVEAAAITRVLMVHDAPGWLEADLDGRLLGDGPITSARPVPHPAAGLLTVDGAADRAAALAALADEPGALSRALTACFPDGSLPSGRPAVTMRWDPAVGPSAGPAMAVGWLGSAADRSRPHGRVHLAGDHTGMAWIGTLEAAVASGRRAAAEAIDAG